MIEIRLNIYDFSTPDMAENEAAAVKEMLNEGWHIAYENTVYDSKDDNIWYLVRWQRETDDEGGENVFHPSDENNYIPF